MQSYVFWNNSFGPYFCCVLHHRSVNNSSFNSVFSPQTPTLLFSWSILWVRCESHSCILFNLFIKHPHSVPFTFLLHILFSSFAFVLNDNSVIKNTGSSQPHFFWFSCFFLENLIAALLTSRLEQQGTGVQFIKAIVLMLMHKLPGMGYHRVTKVHYFICIWHMTLKNVNVISMAIWEFALLFYMHSPLSPPLFLFTVNFLSPRKKKKQIQVIWI